MTVEQGNNRFSRRAFLQSAGVGAAALGLGVVGSRRVNAQLTPTTASEAGFYRFRVGTLNVTVITDGYLNLPTAALATNAPEGALGTLLSANYLPEDLFVAPAQVMLIETDEHLALIDTGLGSVAIPGFETDTNRLMPTLALLGVDAGAIDTVILSHAHPDHIGGLSDDAATPYFPNATYYIAQTEWDFWSSATADTDNDTFNFFVTTAQQKLLPLDAQTERFAPDTDIIPGIRAVAAPGHTPGHSAFLIGDGADRVLNIGDAALHFVIGLEAPGWYNGLEVDSAAAEATRRALFQQAADERIRVFGYHFPFPGLGYAVRVEAEDRWEYVPVS